MPRPKRDDVTPLTVTVFDDKGRRAIEFKVNGWTNANILTAHHQSNGERTEVAPRTD